MPSKSRRSATLVILLLPLLASCSGGQDATQQRSQAPQAVTVAVLHAEPVTLTRELPGRTNPYLVAEVRPQVTGIVEERLFTEGSRVEAGQALYQLDDAIYRATHDSATAALERAQAAEEVARLEAKRAEELAAEDAISDQELDNLRAAWNQARAEVSVAEAQVASTAVKLGYARITSPIGGWIGKSSVTPGALVTADQETPLATVRQLDPIYVDLTQSASELLELRHDVSRGAARRADRIPVTVILEDGSRYPHDGELAFEDVSVDPSTGSYALRVVVPNPDHLLMPGMYVRARVSTAILSHALLVPQQGIARDPTGNTSAMVVSGDDTVEQREVTVDRTVGNNWLVRDGLSEGDRVIVEGLQKIRPGMPVSVTEVMPIETPPMPGAPASSGETDTSAGTAGDDA